MRDYITALQRGDPDTADLYLANGSPDENFIDAKTQIASLTANRNSDGSWKVDADLRSPGGEYFESFVVAQTGQGYKILDKTAIKP